ncbi:hypothetical protein Prudu_1353S000100 [Prunus dulcis]|uniref:Protein FAR1-RELATED SEQUENCE n=1 Tax=Prunus dulcis TaxID=3755 RepID=A0A5H2YFG0_PRUDU|nr:hypothetical protein Prudu_1353S000100 [Prunus dulcis]
MAMTGLVDVLGRCNSRRAYGFYGDVVVFDTTFNTNRYDLTFAQSWELITMKAMPGGEPETIITNQDAAMTRAISISLPTTFHRLCIWHITSKFSIKLPHSAYKEYWREFQKAIWDTENKDEFDAKWNIVVTKAGLTDHPWLSSMFDLRESWVPAYARQFFAAGMSSSQRAEGSHGFFKQYISRRNSLMDFIIRFEMALSHQHQKKVEETAKSGLVSDANGNEIKDSADPGLLIKRSTMSRLASDVVEDALMSEEGCELLSETLKSLQVKLKLLKDGPKSEVQRKVERVTGAKEKTMKREIRHCRSGAHIGHDRRQCPRNLNTPTSPSNNDESTPIDRSDPLFDEFDRMHGPTK